MFNLTVVTPEKRILLNQEIDEVTVPGHRGELNILPGHAQLVTTLDTGILRWRTKGSTTQSKVVISWGYCEVSHRGVEVLADVADLPEEIDADESKKLLLTTEKKLASETLTDEAWEEAQRQIKRLQKDLEVLREK
jgi:F-type H+-transporting ATPase subunit epsilon